MPPSVFRSRARRALITTAETADLPTRIVFVSGHPPGGFDLELGFRSRALEGALVPRGAERRLAATRPGTMGGMADLTRAELAARIDHTLLRPEATSAEVRALAEDANGLMVAAACVHPNRVRLLAQILDGPAACAVAGFPTGAHVPGLVAAEAAAAVAHGADEVDMVADLGAAAEGNFDAVRVGVELVRAAVPGAVLKVIVESALWSSENQLAAVCSAAVDGGADFVKTSTGFHPAGGASVDAVTVMARVAHPRGVRVKASGGIRTLAEAVAMLKVGADRVGCSATADILAGLR